MNGAQPSTTLRPGLTRRSRGHSISRSKHSGSFSFIARTALTSLVCSIAFAGAAWSQDTTVAPMKSTAEGVFTAEQATRGQDTYAAVCLGCHTLSSHIGGQFAADWEARPLWDLFSYIRETMPKGDPGTLSIKEYADVLAYILKLNELPAGKDEMPADSAGLKKIKLQFPKRQR
jgi:S-disulfanyl-L-cysteine oxidoreductase SoxD